MRVLLKGTGTVIFLGSGLILFIAYLSFMGQWLGFQGYLIAIFLAPGLVIFPAIVWIKTGAFPVGYFLILAIGFFGGTLFFWLGSIGES